MSLLVFKCIYGLAPDYLSNEIIMEIEVSERARRNINENNVFIPYVNIDGTKNAFSYRGPLVWNSLKDDLKECTDINDFKRKAKLHFMNVTV